MHLGFAFKNEKVLLIKKERPDWQKGLLNGPGGGIEKDEMPISAMVREFKEETGLEISGDRWELFTDLTIHGEIYCKVYFFKVTLEESEVPTTVTDEKIVEIDLHTLPSNVLPNLKWLIPMAMTKPDTFVSGTEDWGIKNEIPG